MKKLIPLAVLTKIQPLIEANQHLIKLIKDSKYSFCFKDADKSSNFFFQIGHQDESGNYVVEYRPIDGQRINSQKVQLNVDEMVNAFTNWLKVLDNYNKLHTIFDDPILVFYENEFYRELVMDEPDADTIPFDFKRQLYLDRYIESVKEILKKFETEQSSQEKKEEIQEMIRECETLQNEITILPKNKAIKKVADIWAKGRKFSMSLIKEFLTEFKKESFKWISKKALDGSGGFINEVNAILDSFNS